MTDTTTPIPELEEQEAPSNIVVGIGPRGIMIRITEGDQTASAYLGVEEAYVHAGHVNAAGVMLEQSAYAQQMQRQREAEELMRQMATGAVDRAGGKLWTP